MPNRVVLPNTKLPLIGSYTAKPKPKWKDLQNGFEVMVWFDGVEKGVEKCMVIEATSSSVVVQYYKKVWPGGPGEHAKLRVGPDLPAVPGEKYALLTITKRVAPSQVLAYASEWNWHGRVYTMGGKCLGLLDPAVLDQLQIAS